MNGIKTAIWMTHREVACWNFTAANLARLKAELPVLDPVVCTDEATFRTALQEARIGVTIWHFEPAWFDQAPRLRWLATPAAGRDYFVATPPAHVTVTYGSFHGRIMAETALGMIVAANRGIIHTALLQGGDPWPRAVLSEVIRPVGEGHLLVAGFGHIGRHIGRLAKALGMRVTGVRRHPAITPEDAGAADAVVSPTEMDTLLPSADHLLLILPGGAASDGFLDRRRLGLLPPHAWVHNLGRGNAIDTEALITSLRDGSIAGACLDVYDAEPLAADHPLRHTPNVLLMPHASAISPHYMDYFLDEFQAQFRALDPPIRWSTA
mgnify:CR=1 FL=1